MSIWATPSLKGPPMLHSDLVLHLRDMEAHRDLAREIAGRYEERCADLRKLLEERGDRCGLLLDLRPKLLEQDPVHRLATDILSQDLPQTNA